MEPSDRESLEKVFAIERRVASKAIIDLRFFNFFQMNLVLFLIIISDYEFMSV